MQPAFEFMSRLANEVRKFKKGSDARHRKAEGRNRIIADLIEQGITVPQEIHRHLQDNHPELIQRRKDDKAAFIGEKMMMKVFRRAEQRE